MSQRRINSIVNGKGFGVHQNITCPYFRIENIVEFEKSRKKPNWFELVSISLKIV
jgi:hypothetical protein